MAAAGAFNPSDPLAPGRRVGKYEVVSRLAMGGMAEIYLARATGIEGFEKHVVLKRILPQFAENETFVRLFLNEARIAATLDHPNIGSVYDIGQTDGAYFFTMEYLHGEDTGHILTELAKRSARIPLEHALAIIVGVASGLHFAHDKRGMDGQPMGIIHRDISPSNVVVTYDGGVKLVDFGIAKVTAHAEFTGTGALKGKIAYMSPEQCAAQPLDRRSDIFSLGVLLYEITTQTRLFKGETEVATLNNVREARVPPPSSRLRGYPPELETIVNKALARLPKDRYATGRELQLAIESFAQKNGLSLSNAQLGEWMEKTLGRKREPWRDAPRSTWSIAVPETTPSAIPGSIRSHDQRPAPPTTLETPSAIEQGRIDRRKQRHRGLALAAAVVLLGAGAVGAKLALSSWTPSGPAATAVLIVTEQGTVSPEGTPQIIKAAPPAPVVATAVVPPAPPTHTERKSPRVPRSSSTGKDFTAPFSRKQKDIERCFNSNPEEARSVGQVSVRFETAVDGRVTSAQVQPARLAETHLGACVARIASSTNFGPQAKAIAFSITLDPRMQNLAAPPESSAAP